MGIEVIKKIVAEAKKEAEDVQANFDSVTETLIFDAIEKYEKHLNSKKKFVWLNINKGFSNSWSSKEQEECNPGKDVKAKEEWKLIEYNCITDENFKFNRFMKLK